MFDTEIKTFMDGKAWCATRPDFVNLQESLAGFGETEAEAIENLLETEYDNSCADCGKLNKDCICGY